MIGVAPAPLYNTLTEVYDFVARFNDALRIAQKARVDEKSDVKGTGELLHTT